LLQFTLHSYRESLPEPKLRVGNTRAGTVQTFYQLLSVEPSASADDIKKAFRAEIARYHPDKVQHLGTQFLEIAARRAAQLTEAYRTLMNPEMRSEYDRLNLGRNGAASPPASRDS